MGVEELPPLTGSPLLDPWRIRYRLALRGELDPAPPHPATRSEQMLWAQLEDDPAGWLREYATGPYRLDFYCPSARLAIEVDGPSHWGRRGRERDTWRDDWHRCRGITTRRFSAEEVEKHLPWVLDQVLGLVQAARPAPGTKAEEAVSRTADHPPREVEAEPVHAVTDAGTQFREAADLLAAEVAEACRTILPAPRHARSLRDLLDF